MLGIASFYNEPFNFQYLERSITFHFIYCSQVVTGPKRKRKTTEAAPVQEEIRNIEGCIVLCKDSDGDIIVGQVEKEDSNNVTLIRYSGTVDGAWTEAQLAGGTVLRENVEKQNVLYESACQLTAGRRLPVLVRNMLLS